MISFKSNKTIAVGEAMVEMAETGDGTYRKGFAGDTMIVRRWISTMAALV